MSGRSEIIEAPPAAPPATFSVGAIAPWYTVAILTLLYTLAFVDRQVISLLVTPIKRDLGISDVQVSLLIGLAFVVLFSILGIPAGWLVDRVSRKRVVAFGVASWSLMVIVSGFARSFGQLFFGRVGVGIGESTLVPASFALVQATLPPKQRGKAFGMLSLGPTFGGALSLVLGGLIFAAAEAGQFHGLPIISALKPWQTVFVLLGLCGLPLALLALTLREPLRSRSFGANGQNASFADALLHVRAHRRLYVLLVGFITFSAMWAFSFQAWAPSMLGRNFGLSPAQVGLRLGSIALISSLVGQFVFGTIIDRLAARGRADAAPMVGLFTVVATLLLAIAIPFATTLDSASVLLILYYVVQGVFYPVGANCLARVTPRNLIGKVTGLYLIFQSGVAAAFGPTLVALAGQYFFTGPRAIGYGMALVAFCVSLIALAFLVPLRAAMVRTDDLRFETGAQA
jgi:MFS family permease